MKYRDIRGVLMDKVNIDCTKEKKEILEGFDKNFEKDLALIEERNQEMAEFIVELSETQYAKFEKFLLAEK